MNVKKKINYADDKILGLRGRYSGKILRMPKTDTKSAITEYNNIQMQANSTKFHYMHTRTQTQILNVKVSI